MKEKEIQKRQTALIEPLFEKIDSGGKLSILDFTQLDHLRARINDLPLGRLMVLWKAAPAVIRYELLVGGGFKPRLFEKTHCPLKTLRAAMNYVTNSGRRPPIYPIRYIGEPKAVREEKLMKRKGYLEGAKDVLLDIIAHLPNSEANKFVRLMNEKLLYLILQEEFEEFIELFSFTELDSSIYCGLTLIEPEILAWLSENDLELLREKWDFFISLKRKERE